MSIKYFNIVDEKPEEERLLWIFTYQEHVNVAYYHKSDNLFYNKSAPFVDKFGKCDVCQWCYANVPDFEGECEQ